MNHFTDTHCHLDFDRFDQDRTAVIARAWDAGLAWIVNPGIDLDTSLAALELASAYQGQIFAAVGVHPNFGKPWSAAILAALREQASQPGVVAIGEIGLDYYRDVTSVEQQRHMFHDQLTLAAEMSLPVIIHNRDASADVLDMLRQWQQALKSKGNALAERPGVLHSFSGDLDTAQAAVALQFYLGIGGPVTFTNAPELKEIIRQIPIDRLLLETDAPFLTPHPHRGKRNEPGYIPLIAAEIARLHQLSVEEVAKITYANACRLFFDKKPDTLMRDA